MPGPYTPSMRNMGAKISGIGSNLLKIEGVEKLNGCDHTLLADMIEVGSFIGLAVVKAVSQILRKPDENALVAAVAQSNIYSIVLLC